MRKGLLRGSYALMAVVLVVTLGAASRDTGPDTPGDRAAAVAESIKCPTCRSQSVAESDEPASKAIRAEIARRIEAGESDDQIRAHFAATLGEDILLRPRSSGFAGLVWVLPVAAVVVAGAGLAYAFWRWRRWGDT